MSTLSEPKSPRASGLAEKSPGQRMRRIQRGFDHDAKQRIAEYERIKALRNEESTP